MIFVAFLFCQVRTSWVQKWPHSGQPVGCRCLLKKHPSGKEDTRENTLSGAGQQLLLLCCRAKAYAKGMFFHGHRYHRYSRGRGSLVIRGRLGQNDLAQSLIKLRYEKRPNREPARILIQQVVPRGLRYVYLFFCVFSFVVMLCVFMFSFTFVYFITHITLPGLPGFFSNSNRHEQNMLSATTGGKLQHESAY